MKIAKMTNDIWCPAQDFKPSYRYKNLLGKSDNLMEYIISEVPSVVIMKIVVFFFGQESRINDRGDPLR
jgi:hypothetical protein